MNTGDKMRLKIVNVFIRISGIVEYSTDVDHLSPKRIKQFVSRNQDVHLHPERLLTTYVVNFHAKFLNL